MKSHMPIIELKLQPHLKNRRLEFESIAQMLTVRAHETPDAIHVLYQDQVLTYKEMNDRVNRVANFMKEKGIGKGDIVGVMVTNSPDIYYAMWAAQKLGGVALAMNYCLKGREIKYILDDAKPKMCFIGSEYLADFFDGYELAANKPLVVEVETEATGSYADVCEEMNNILAHYPTDECLVEQRPEDPFLLLYSSGTTGNPKGILLSNRAQLAQCRCFNQMGYMHAGDVMLLMLPMFHVNPICVFTYPMSYAGLTLCIAHKFSVREFWPTVMKYNISIIMGVPTMFDYLINKTTLTKEERQKVRIHTAFTGGAPLSLVTRRKFKEKYNIDFLVGYGLTEGCGGNSTEPALGRYRDGSCGLVHPGEEIILVDTNGYEVPDGENGEICIKGDCIMSGYLNKPEQTERALRGGYLHTGDIGHFDADGYLYVMDRMKDMILRGGENIYPRQIEIQMEEHPDISAVAVIGVPDKLLGQKVKAFVIQRENTYLTAEALREWLLKRMASYEVPEVYEFVEKLPRTPSGKVQKFKLREGKGCDNANRMK